MKVLVACEESQEVCKAFRELGHEAYSCDLKPCSGGHPEWHIQGDALQVIYYHALNRITLQSGGALFVGAWDMIIAFPPCTHIAVSGAKWFAEKRTDGRQQNAIRFFMMLANVDIPRICIENPVGIMSTEYRKPDQCIQPYQFGHDASKKTCLWLKGLDPLVLNPSQYIQPRIVNGKPRWGNQTDSGQNRLTPSEHRAADRARTYSGIAKAMAEQWGGK